MMLNFKSLNRYFILGILVGSFLLSGGHLCHAATKKDRKAGKNTPVMTVIELQSELMGYADRMESMLFQSFEDFDASEPDFKTRTFILGDIVFTMSAAFNIAGQPNPEVALLDMIVITSLGRSVYENDHRKTFGKSVDPIVNSFQTLDKEIWDIAVRVLDAGQKQELYQAIQQWRTQHPGQTAYSYVRFGDFAKERGRSTLVPQGKAGGLFSSVKEATQQVEETRMLAERGMYLGTRLPLLTGFFTEYWLSKMLANPQMAEVLSDLNRVSLVSERLAEVTEQLPQQISAERARTIKQISKEMAKQRQTAIEQVVKETHTWSDTTIDRVMDRVAVERKDSIEQFMNLLAVERQQTIKELLAEEQRVRGLVTELRGTLTEGNNLLQSATTLAEKLNLDEPSTAADSKPFQIQEYRNTFAELSATAGRLTELVDKINFLLTSDGLERLLSQIDKTIGTVEGHSEKVVDHTFRQALILLLIWLVGYVLVKVIFHRLAIK